MNSSKTIEILQNIESEDTKYIGNSLSILAQFAREKLPVSQGFIISTLGFNSFLDLTDLKRYYDNSQKSKEDNFKGLKKAFDIVEIPEILSANIKKCYSRISGFTEAYVNLRALVVDKDTKEISHRSFTIFDIRGEEKILKSLITLYRNIIYDNSSVVSKFFTGELQIVVLIQKAQQSEASGVMFTTDIISKDRSKLVIEAVYGLESLVDFDPIIPDQYIYNKSKGEFLEKHITKQEFMVVRQGGNRSPVERVSISSAWQKRQKLDDKHLITLAKTGMIIEEGIGEPQQVIWSFEAGKVWINFIESCKKFSLKSGYKSTLQELVDEQVFTFDESQKKNSMDINLHVPEEVIESKNISLDLHINDKVEKEELINNVMEENKGKLKKSKKPEMKNKNNKTKKTKISEEPLLEGRHFSGHQAEGEVCFDPMQCKTSNILVLKGDENLAADIKVAGFIIEDESDILAEKLHEYFTVPVITGVPLARKILKPGEKVVIDGNRGHIYETLPFSEQIGEIEMNFVAHKNHDTKVTNISVPIKEDSSMTLETDFTSDIDDKKNIDIEEISAPVILEIPEETKEEYEDLSASVSQLLSNHESSEPTYLSHENSKSRHIKIDTETTITSILSKESNDNDILKELYAEEVSQTDSEDDKFDISRLLNLVEEDTEVVEVKTSSLDNVQGLDSDDTFNLWGKSLERVISASKTMSPVVASQALEHVIEDRNDIMENSKEIEFDTEEEYIAIQLHKEEENKEFACPFIPTATKVYVNLIDEKLPSEFKNFDGIIFSSSFDKDIYLEMLEDTLSKSDNREVIAIAPPYEKMAFEDFLKKIHEMRNKGHRNLTLVLPDYRNKAEIAEMKKQLSSVGLKRSSTFGIYANVSRTINIFRLNELNKTVVDGVFIDLFRLKMNMLGVEKLTASTNYAEGMKNLVEYVHENLSDDNKSVINISGFNNATKALDHILALGFWAISSSLSNADKVKKKISGIEKRSILEERSSTKKINLKRR